MSKGKGVWNRGQELLKLCGQVVASYIIAAAAAGICFGLFKAFGAILLHLQNSSGLLSALGHATFSFVFVTYFTAVFIGGFAIVAFVPAILALRLLGLRGWPSHLLAGLVVSAVTIVLLRPHRPPFEALTSDHLLFLVGGIAGIVYWAAFNYLFRAGTRPSGEDEKSVLEQPPSP